jgi:predicted GH43/DUF377 family glycosyl hydrolase
MTSPHTARASGAEVGIPANFGVGAGATAHRDFDAEAGGASGLLQRSGILLEPQSSRVLVKPFYPGSESKCRRLISQVLALPETEAGAVLHSVLQEFEDRHINLEGVLSERFRQVSHYLLDEDEPSFTHRLLIGAYFMSEYALESAALFNPSIVAHPDQSGIAKKSLRVVLSLRATGEGHISSIEFRHGIVDGQGNVNIDPASSCVTAPMRVDNPLYDKQNFRMKLHEIGLHDQFTSYVLEPLAAAFRYAELEDSIQDQLLGVGKHNWGNDENEAARRIRWLAQSNYQVDFTAAVPLSQRIIFPQSPTEEQGIEDARFVQFFEDDGRMSYFATYTAWNGQVTLPQLIETDDFLHFRLSTLNGHGVRNKGMALFPRRIDGRYAMLSRQDDESLFLMYSDDVHFWRQSEPLAGPEQPWELQKIGNCGSPIETGEGWLVLTHGVGPMRKYCMGAMLLDLEQPTKVIGRLKQPLISPNANEREGYVPNVVYSCGSLLHADKLVIPYALSDYASTIATVEIDRLLAMLRR